MGPRRHYHESYDDACQTAGPDFWSLRAYLIRIVFVMENVAAEPSGQRLLLAIDWLAVAPNRSCRGSF